MLMDVPTGRCRGLGMNPLDLASPDNPFLRTALHIQRTGSLDFAGSPLEAYYARHRPETAAAVLGLSWTSGPAALPPLAALVLPWHRWPADAFVAHLKDCADRYWQKLGIALDSSHGATEFGPVSPMKGMQEMHRLERIVRSLQTEGFQLERGTVVATLLVGNEPGQWACHIRDGLHRVSVLAALGVPHLPIAIAGGETPAVVRRSEVEAWTHVRDGLYTPQEALFVFDRLIAGI